MSTLAPAKSVASVSLTDADRDPEGFSQELGASFERYGFAIIADHGIPADLIARAEEKAKAFFALPDAVKRAYHQKGKGGAPATRRSASRPPRARSITTSRNSGTSPASCRRATNIAIRWRRTCGPRRSESFRDTFLEFYAAFDRTGLKILEAIARYLGLAPDYFVDTVKDGNSILRLLHYPPIPGDGPNVRAGAHEDINTITLLLGAEEAGLQLLDRDGDWLPVTPRPGELAVNIGDMLQRLTNNVLKSTTHRVVNPPPERRGHSRYSMPFFLHFRSDFPIETLPDCMSAERPNLYPEPITADEYLQERLREIKLV